MNDLELLAAKISADKERYSEEILGGVDDFSRYTRLCGVIHGLSLALEHVTDRIATNRKEDDF